MNSIFTIFPHYQNGSWVFTDESKGLYNEALVSGVPELILALSDKLEIDNPQDGFSVRFSGEPFPDHQSKLVWLNTDSGGVGNWFKDELTGIEAWLCPSLFKYFQEIPKEIYIAVAN
jgi:hypothetical protein